jgi:DNA polymerase (family 10)
MINAELSRVFDRIADLLEIDGADRFRVNSYRRAGRTIKDHAENVAQMCADGRLTELPGVGKGTADRVKQYIETGRIDVLTELEAKLPEGLPDLLDIPGMGPKKVALAYTELGVAGIEDLKRVIESGELEQLPGLGKTSVEKLREGIAFLETSSGRTPLGEALPLAETLAEFVREMPGVERVEIAGSLRRGEETIGDVDIVCVAKDGKDVIKRFTKIEAVERVLAAGSTKGSVTVRLDAKRTVQADLRVVPPESFGAALQYFTGSKDHNVRLRELAIRRKWRLNEYGLTDGDKTIAGRDEAGIYKKLGLPLIPPECRQDKDEFDPHRAFDDLVTLDDIRGDLHMHTVASDGKCTIEEMASAAKRRGYAYIAICDHSKSSAIANGLSIDRMWNHIEAIREANKKIKGIEILAGTECDILGDGTMDYPDDLLAACDWVVASIHSAMGKSKSKKHTATGRTIAAMENPYVCAIGHPTGRIIARREPMDIDITEITAAAARTATMLEINASWKRLDLNGLHARIAIDAGVTLTINTDAHHIDQLAQMRYGIMTARRAAATRSDVANTQTPAALRKRIASKRK